MMFSPYFIVWESIKETGFPIMAASRNVVQRVSLLSDPQIILDVRQIFLSASIMRGTLNFLLIPNPTVSERVNALVPLPSTILFSLNGIFPRMPSNQAYPSRAFESTGIVIHIAVSGLLPGLVNALSLQD